MRFEDVYLPDSVPGFPCYSVPVFSTTLVESASGDESANENWANARHQFRLPKAIRNHAEFEALRKHWYVIRGPAKLWPFRDPLDFASVDLHCANVTPEITRTDQALGVGDDLETVFQLVKTYTTGGLDYARTIELPVVASVLIGMDGQDPAVFAGGPWGYSVDREGGRVIFDNPPPVGVVLTSGFLFDVPVRFENDTTLEGIVESMHVTGFSDLVLIERRLC